MISINNLSFSYGEKTIFKDYSLKIEQGDRICLFGESGCGKSTLLKLILGLLKPNSGKLDINVSKFSAVFQEDRLLPFKTVLENITLIGARNETAISHINALGLEGNENKFPSELSGGMQRRAAIARALSSDYDCLILDEPFAGLDESNIESSAKHISEALNGRTLILVSHSKKEAELLGARILEINKTEK